MMVEIDTPGVESHVEKKEVMSAEIREWLHSHEEDFFHALEAFARKMDQGFQALEPAIGRKDLAALGAEGRNATKIETTSEKGEYTGYGLCGIASAVLEKVLHERYGEGIEVTAVRVQTSNKDVDFESSDRVASEPHQHWIVRFHVVNETQRYFIDATYRQVNWRANPRKVMFIAPQEAEERLYNYREWEKRFADTDERKAKEMEPVISDPGKIHESNLFLLDNNLHGGVNREDYMNLFKTFEDKSPS